MVFSQSLLASSKVGLKLIKLYCVLGYEIHCLAFTVCYYVWSVTVIHSAPLLSPQDQSGEKESASSLGLFCRVSKHRIRTSRKPHCRERAFTKRTYAVQYCESMYLAVSTGIKASHLCSPTPTAACQSLPKERQVRTVCIQPRERALAMNLTCRYIFTVQPHAKAVLFEVLLQLEHEGQRFVFSAVAEEYILGNSHVQSNVLNQCHA